MNDDDFEALVRKIQDEAMADARTALGEKGFERWRNPKFCGELADADSRGKVKGVCGDTMEMFVKFDGARLSDVHYRTDGCGSSGVAGSFTAELAHGKTVEEVFDMTGDDVLTAIGGFPDSERHCAFLAVSTLQDAVNNYLVDQTRKEKSN